MEFDYNALGKNISRYRKQADLTQAELAEASGLSSSHISSIETAKRIPSLATIAAIANSLDVGIDQLCYGELKNTENFFVREIVQMSKNFQNKEKLLAIGLIKGVLKAVDEQKL